MAIGRPTAFTPEVIQQIFEELTNGTSERTILQKPEMPGWSTWIAFKRRNKDNEEFQSHYAIACQAKLEAWEAKIMEVANDESRDLQPDGKGGFKSDNTFVNRDRLRIDSMKWLMSKLHSKKYGDRIEQEHSGQIAVTPILNMLMTDASTGKK